MLLISRLINWSGLRISYSKVFSSGYRGELGYPAYRGELGYPGYRGELGYPEYRGELDIQVTEENIGYLEYRGELGYPGYREELEVWISQSTEYYAKEGGSRAWKRDSFFMNIFHLTLDYTVGQSII